jgi:hypothetical protein
MVFLALLKDGLSLFGLLGIIATTVKISRGYPIRRWFF